MTGPSNVVDFFALEAAEHLDRLDELAGAASGRRSLDVDAAARAARALRGSATIARQGELAELAAAIEQAVGAVRSGGLAWGPRAADALVAAVDDFRALMRAARSWGATESDRVRRRAAELRALVPAGDAARSQSRIVPVSSLAPSDGGAHIVYRAPAPPITADQRFRQAAVPLASTLRRLIADARAADPASDAARQSVGEDLRGAIRDLRELAASYGIAPVVNFTAAREEPLARLDAGALDTVEAAAGALIESAGAAWARSTPPGSAPAVRGAAAATPPRPAPATPAVWTAADATPAATTAAPPVPPAPPVVADATESVPTAPGSAPRAAPTGQALVALLETGISGIAGIGGDRLDAGLDAAHDSDGGAVSAATPPEQVVPVADLVYRGPRALDRAREIRDALRAAPFPPEPGLLAELYDLIDLAAE